MKNLKKTKIDIGDICGNIEHYITDIGYFSHPHPNIDENGVTKLG